MGIPKEIGASGNIYGFSQRTLKSAAGCTGVALHSGDAVSLTLHPAGIDSGIKFRRVDAAGGGALIAARWDRVVDTKLCTVLGDGNGVTVGTVEHLMAALAGAAIDNATIEIDGPEVPIMDGSAEPFLSLIEGAGIRVQAAPRRVVRIEKAITVDDGDAFASLVPGSGFSVSFEIDFDNAAVSRQRVSVSLINGTFKKELARARTFGFLHEVEEMRAAGLARGGSLDNAVIVGDGHILNQEGLRFEDEFVRHKALDAVGDLYLAGAPIIGHFHGVCSGHAINNRLLRALFADQAAWSFDDLCPDDLDPGIPALWADEDAPAVAAPA